MRPLFLAAFFAVLLASCQMDFRGEGNQLHREKVTDIEALRTQLAKEGYNEYNKTGSYAALDAALIEDAVLIDSIIRRENGLFRFYNLMEHWNLLEPDDYGSLPRLIHREYITIRDNKYFCMYLSYWDPMEAGVFFASADIDNPPKEINMYRCLNMDEAIAIAKGEKDIPFEDEFYIDRLAPGEGERRIYYRSKGEEEDILVMRLWRANDADKSIPASMVGSRKAILKTKPLYKGASYQHVNNHQASYDDMQKDITLYFQYIFRSQREPSFSTHPGGVWDLSIPKEEE